jgi:L-threonylcarbamoyladenylate synthase
LIILKASKSNFFYLLEYSRYINKPFIFPTDTIYGIGAEIANIEANLFIYEVKYRKLTKPFPILIGSIEQLDMLVEKLTPVQMAIIRKFWPGPFTFILYAKAELNNIYKNNNKVAIRLPSLKWLREALKERNSPITATSANISNHEYINDIEKIINTFKSSMPLYLYNDSVNIQSSTVIDISNENNVELIRNPHMFSLSDITFK